MTVFGCCLNRERYFPAPTRATGSRKPISLRKRAIGRYNSNLNELLDFWAGCLAQGERKIRALGIEDGIDATFRISPNTSYSRRSAV